MVCKNKEGVIQNLPLFYCIYNRNGPWYLWFRYIIECLYCLWVQLWSSPHKSTPHLLTAPCQKVDLEVAISVILKLCSDYGSQNISGKHAYDLSWEKKSLNIKPIVAR